MFLKTPEAIVAREMYFFKFFSAPFQWQCIFYPAHTFSQLRVLYLGFQNQQKIKSLLVNILHISQHLTKVGCSFISYTTALLSLVLTSRKSSLFLLKLFHKAWDLVRVLFGWASRNYDRLSSACVFQPLFPFRCLRRPIDFIRLYSDWRCLSALSSFGNFLFP